MSDTGPTTAAPASSPLDARGLAAAVFVECKPLLKSRTLWSLVVVCASMLAAQLGHKIADAQQQQIIDLVTSVVNGGGLTAAALFRVVATTTLS
ncbi:MAG: hypothetical protein ACR2F8_02990 [Caulobacteraceae bacterium]